MEEISEVKAPQPTNLRPNLLTDDFCHDYPFERSYRFEIEEVRIIQKPLAYASGLSF